MNQSGQRPLFVILGGPNGAGKTTSAFSILPQELRIAHFVNADLIARGLSPLNPSLADFEAGRIMVGRIREFMHRQVSFAIETTLASKSVVRIVRECTIAGYETRLVFVSLDSPETAAARVAIRVAKGGHDITAETIRRRYFRGLYNFFNIYRSAVDQWTLLDNSGDDFKLVAQGNGTIEQIYDNDSFRLLEEKSRDGR